jgi:hypothetical protein
MLRPLRVEVLRRLAGDDCQRGVEWIAAVYAIEDSFAQRLQLPVRTIVQGY